MDGIDPALTAELANKAAELERTGHIAVRRLVALGFSPAEVRERFDLTNRPDRPSDSEAWNVFFRELNAQVERWLITPLISEN
jgi:hypothetical protein